MVTDRPIFHIVRGVPFPLVRIFFFAMAAVAASVYALVRHYDAPRTLLVVTPAEPDSGEIQAPDLEPVAK